MKTKVTILFFTLFANLFAFSQSKTTANTVVIVHGAWSSADDWQGVAAKLKAEGNDVTTVNLPGHGKDNTPIPSLQLQTYVDAVKKAIGNKTGVVLVGHSFGGIVISQVAEQIPTKIKKLIYVAAYVPKDGESLLTLAKTDAESHVGKYLQINEKGGTASIAKEGITEVFLADAPKQVADYVSEHLKPEPLAPLATPVKLTESNFGKVKKAFVFTSNDNTIGYQLQQTMAKGAGATESYTLPSSHTPFVSMPDVLAAVIAKESR